jgi:hypothetical protein
MVSGLGRFGLRRVLASRAVTFVAASGAHADAGDVSFPGVAPVAMVVHGVECKTVSKNDPDGQKRDA